MPAPFVYLVITGGGDPMPRADGDAEIEFDDFDRAWARAVELTERGFPCEVIKGRGFPAAFRVVAAVARLGVGAHPLSDMPVRGYA